MDTFRPPIAPSALHMAKSAHDGKKRRSLAMVSETALSSHLLITSMVYKPRVYYEKIMCIICEEHQDLCDEINKLKGAGALDMVKISKTVAEARSYQTTFLMMSGTKNRYTRSRDAS